MIKWLKETYTELPTQPGWIGLVLAICVVMVYLDSLTS